MGQACSPPSPASAMQPSTGSQWTYECEINSLRQSKLSFLTIISVTLCFVFAHSGVITNTGGKVIVRKMAGQNIYKGSNSNGVRSLSLPKWRESFVVSGVNDEVNNVKHSPLGLSPPPPNQPTTASLLFQWGSPRKE